MGECGKIIACVVGIGIFAAIAIVLGLGTAGKQTTKNVCFSCLI